MDKAKTVMFRVRSQRAIGLAIAGLVWSSLLWVGGCESLQQSQEQPDLPGEDVIVSAAALEGSQLSAFLPSAESGYQQTLIDEKPGLAAASLEQDGKQLAILSIMDTAIAPSEAGKYRDSINLIQGYPAVEQGGTITGVLVGARVQVTVRTFDSNFDQSDREAWIRKFDLPGLAELIQAQ